MFRSSILFFFKILYGSNGLIHPFRLAILLWLRFVFRCLVFCRLSFCKVLSCWRYDILLIGWLLSATVFIPIYFSFADVLFPFMFIFLIYLYRCNALNSSGDIYGVVLLFSFFFYPETDLYTDLLNGTWYFWWSDAWFAWFVFRLPGIFYTVIYGYLLCN